MNKMRFTTIAYIMFIFSIFLLNFYGELYVKNILLKCLFFIIYVFVGCSIKYIHVDVKLYEPSYIYTPICKTL